MHNVSQMSHANHDPNLSQRWAGPPARKTPPGPAGGVNQTHKPKSTPSEHEVAYRFLQAKIRSGYGLTSEVEVRFVLEARNEEIVLRSPTHLTPFERFLFRLSVAHALVALDRLADRGGWS